MSPDSATQEILIPIDVQTDSTMAIEVARALVKPGDGLTFLHVIPLLDTSGVLLPSAISVEALAREIRDDAERRLEMVVADAKLPGEVRVKSAIANGNPGEEIVNAARRSGASLIIMETAGKGAAKRMMIGSVADHVARSAPIPVLLVRQPEAGHPISNTFTRIVLPLDLSARSRQALPVASEFARRLNLPVEIVSVRTIDGNSYLYGAAFSIAAYDEIDAGLQRQIQLVLQAAESELTAKGIAVSTLALFGPVAPTIEEVLRPGDLVIMTSHGRSGIRRWLLGSVAEHLVRHGSAPVLLVPAAELLEGGH